MENSSLEKDDADVVDEQLDEYFKALDKGLHGNWNNGDGSRKQKI